MKNIVFKTYLRNPISENRLVNSLALPNVHKDIFIIDDIVLIEFDNSKRSRHMHCTVRGTILYTLRPNFMFIVIIKFKYFIILFIHIYFYILYNTRTINWGKNVFIK